MHEHGEAEQEEMDYGTEEKSPEKAPFELSMTPEEIAVKNGLRPDHPLLQPSYIERYEELFKRFDIDDSGLIDLGELKEMMQAVGQEVPMDDLRKLFEEFDEDDSGGIDFEEFIQIFVKIIG